MKNKLTFVTLIFTVLLFLYSCSQPSDIPEGEETEGTSDTDGRVTEESPDRYEAIRTSGEEWLLVGLKAYEDGAEPKDLTQFFSVPSNLPYLTLYDYLFAYDGEGYQPVAEALFRFIIDKHGIPALLDREKRVEYKNEFLESLGLEPTYVQLNEVETLLSSMDFSSSADYKYVITFDNVTYYFKDLDIGSPTQYNGILYCNTYGLREMIEYLKENSLDEGLDTDRQFNFYMTFDGSGISKTSYPSGDIYINDSYSLLHEAMHAMGIRDNSHIWLSEGICSYFGEMLGFNGQIAASYIHMLAMAEQGYFDERAAAGEVYAQAYKTLYEQYSARGGKLDHADNFDLRLYNDIFCTLVSSGLEQNTVADIYKKAGGKEYSGTGGELNYPQTKSLVLYLADVYGIEKVMQAYHTGDIASALGKDYEGLKAEWQEYMTQFDLK